MERRGAPRVRCGFPCDLEQDGKPLPAAVRNLSAGGLAVVAPIATSIVGDSLAITLKPPGRPPVELVALVWHSRAVRRPRGEAPASQLGLVLSEAGDDYFALLDALSGPAPRCAGNDPRQDPPPTELRLRFAVQVAQAGTPRTRRILVVAPDPGLARVRATEETGAGWTVVDVQPARD